MCGLIASFKTTKKGKAKPVNDFIVNQYQDQMRRGKEGFGIIRINEKGSVQVDRSCGETKFLLDLYLKKASMIIAHHRTPTSTSNLMGQTHPMHISNDLLAHDYLVVHNGIIGNTKDLYKKHIELGFDYQTEYMEDYGTTSYDKWNDSESLAIELALFIEGKVTCIGTTNSAAFIILQINKKNQKATKVLFGRNGISSALNMEKTKGCIQISSEGPGEEVEENLLHSFDIKDRKMKITKEKIPFMEIKPIVVTPVSTSVSTTVNPTTSALSKEIEKEEPAIIERSWVTSKALEPVEEYVIEYAGKGYPEHTANLFQDTILESSTLEITHMVDDALDEELEKAAELMASYKNVLLRRKYDSREDGAYISQIIRVLKAMEMITDNADAIYKIQETMEDQEEVENYNAGFFKSTSKKEDDLELEREAEFRRDMGYAK